MNTTHLYPFNIWSFPFPLSLFRVTPYIPKASLLFHLLHSVLPLILKSHPETPLSLWGFPWLRLEEAPAEGAPFCRETLMQARSGICHPEALPSSPSLDGQRQLDVEPEQRSEASSTLMLLHLHCISLPRHPKCSTSTLPIFTTSLWNRSSTNSMIHRQKLKVTEGLGRWAAPRVKAGQKICTKHSQSKPCTGQKLQGNTISQGTAQNS